MPNRKLRWPLSQSSNKSSGRCSVCLATHQLHLSNGLVHQHGPRNQPCSGSHQPPAPASSLPDNICSSQSTDIDVSPTLIQHPHISGPIIKHIPKSARNVCAILLSDILQQIIHDCNNVNAWSLLLNFGAVVLAKPSSSDQHTSLSTIIKKRVINYLQHDQSTGNNFTGRQLQRNTCTDEKLSKLITAKIEDGNIRAALRILFSDDTTAENNDDTYNKLLERHPKAASARPITSCLTSDDYSLQVSIDEVSKATRSFPTGSSGGPDGIRPQHISDLLNCRESGTTLLSSITSFINTLLKGHCPANVIPILCGGSLTALNKKSGGIRPIAVGYYWRRLAAKCANTYASSKLPAFFSPVQLGVGVPGGCEAAVHACRQYLDNLPDDKIIVKLDFSNAFNCLHRDVMLDAVYSTIPELYAFCHMSYAIPSELKFGNRHISSEEGIQQGDPLGPLTFCLAIQPILRSLNSELIIGYMDDITLGGPATVVAGDVLSIIADGASMGLRLNITKCELITTKHELPQIKPLDQFMLVTPDNATLLGAPLSTGLSMDLTLKKKLLEIKHASDRLQYVSSHDALVLMKSSCGSPKLQHILRCSPCNGHSTLCEIDVVIRSCLTNITNVCLTDLQWTQASLPIKAGGLGIRSPLMVSLSCFLASVSSTLPLQSLLLEKCPNFTSDAHFDSLLLTWTNMCHPLPPPSGSAACLQKSWNKPFVDSSFALLLDSQPDEYNQARLLAAAAAHSGDWLNALPISACGLRLSDEAVRIAVGYRLGARLCDPHDCPCGVFVDCRGSHGLSCRRCPGKTARHNYVNDLIFHALIRAGIPSSKEPAGLSRTDGKRPDGLTLVPWTTGKSALWDVTIIDTVAASYINSTSSNAGSAAEIAASRKEEKYAALSNYIFIPLAFESFGPIGRKATTFLRDLGRRLTLATQDPLETAHLFQRVSVAIQRFNAVCFNSSLPIMPDDLD